MLNPDVVEPAKLAIMQIFQKLGVKNSLSAILCGVLVLCTIFIPIVAGGGTGLVSEGIKSDEQVTPAPEIPKKPFDDIIRRKSEEYQVSFETISKIIDCENDQRNPSVQSYVRYTEGQIKRNPHWGIVGEREKSFGLVQIHLPAWPMVSKDQATDPEFAIDFLAKHLSLGNGGLWTCYK